MGSDPRSRNAERRPPIEPGSFTLNGESIAIEQRVTNIYRREDGGWKIVHYHTDLSPPMLGVLERLRRAAWPGVVRLTR